MAEQDKNLQELQFLEQNIQNILFQKQAFQMELMETETSLKELESAGDEVFKLVGQLMIKADKSKAKEDLENKKKLLDLRLKNIEKQEITLMEKVESLRKEVVDGNKEKQNKDSNNSE